MSYYYRLFLSSFFFLFVASTSHGIDLDDFLNRLKDNHPLFKKELLAVEVAKSKQLQAKGNRDLLISAAPYYTFQEPLPLNPFVNSDIQNAGIEAGISRTFWTTGGTLGINFRGNRLEQSPATLAGVGALGPDRFFENSIGLQYTQPLLKNFAGVLSRLNYDVEGFNIDITTFQSQENQEHFLNSMANRYLDWVLLNQQKKVLKDRLDIAVEDLASTKRQYKSNLVTKVDVIRSEDAVRIVKQNLVLVEGRWKAIQAELSTQISDDSLLKESPSFSIFTFPALPEIDIAKRSISNQSRLLRALDSQSAQVSLLKKAAENEELANLNLVSSLEYIDGASAFDDSSDFSNSNISVALQYEFPWENSAARGLREERQLDQKRVSLQYDETRRSLEASLVNILTQLHELRQVLELNRAQIRSAREKTKEETKLYNQGRSQFTFVIQAKDNVQNARLTYAENAIQYHKLYVEYLDLTDQLFEKDASL